MTDKPTILKSFFARTGINNPGFAEYQKKQPLKIIIKAILH